MLDTLLSPISHSFSYGVDNPFPVWGMARPETTRNTQFRTRFRTRFGHSFARHGDAPRPLAGRASGETDGAPGTRRSIRGQRDVIYNLCSMPWPATCTPCPPGLVNDRSATCLLGPPQSPQHPSRGTRCCLPGRAPSRLSLSTPSSSPPRSASSRQSQCSSRRRACPDIKDVAACSRASRSRIVSMESSRESSRAAGHTSHRG